MTPAVGVVRHRGRPRKSRVRDEVAGSGEGLELACERKHLRIVVGAVDSQPVPAPELQRAVDENEQDERGGDQGERTTCEGGEREADAEPDECRERRADRSEVVVVLEVEVREDEKRADGCDPHADPEPPLG